MQVLDDLLHVHDNGHNNYDHVHDDNHIHHDVYVRDDNRIHGHGDVSDHVYVLQSVHDALYLIISFQLLLHLQ